LAQLGRLDYVVCTLPGSTGFALDAAAEAVLAAHKPMCLEVCIVTWCAGQ
jgi:hypothetical protein